MIDNKKLGIILIVVCILLGALVFGFEQQIDAQSEASCECEEMQEGGFCPHEEQTSWQTYLGIILISGVAALGIYLIFFEKSQKEVISTLEKQKRLQTKEEKFDILMKGLDPEERKIIKAVKDQDGITQQTLRLRADMHKSKLSIVLDRLEKKGLISRKEKGKTKQVFLKVNI
ncbi:MarR family transcriptional regulator [Candidatus Woesearchaeota archaeon]|nr:MarR family transcriptional regulator [Candidatus Woesearchaeota archaeon]